MCVLLIGFVGTCGQDFMATSIYASDQPTLDSSPASNMPMTLRISYGVRVPHTVHGDDFNGAQKWTPRYGAALQIKPRQRTPLLIKH